MCTLVVIQQPDRPFLLLSNRDEYLDRPSAPLDYWPDAPILAGRDLRSGGAWLGFGRQQRWAVLTNIPGPPPPQPPSRGTLVRDYLTGSLTPQQYAQTIERERYAGFNLLLGVPDQLCYLSSQDAPRLLPWGFQEQASSERICDSKSRRPTVSYALGNAPLDQPSPRVERARQLVTESTAHSPEEWLDLFRDPLVWIESPIYGTRCTTLATEVSVWERSRGESAIRQRKRL